METLSKKKTENGLPEKKINVLHICNEVGLGGTERGIIAMCRFMRFGIFEHHVICLTQAGPRATSLTDVATLEVAGENLSQLAGLLSSGTIGVALIHRAGAAEPRWSHVLRACRDARIPLVIEINIFGLIDASPEDEIIDCHLHISKSSYCNFRSKAINLGYSRIERHRVLYIPVEMAGQLEEGNPGLRDLIRSEMGISPDDLVLLRVGRPDYRKWGDLLLYAIPNVLLQSKRARFFLLSAPRSRAWFIERRYSADRVKVLPATNDDRILQRAYLAADIYVHSSRRGESLGVSLIEAMSWGLPVVVDSTPWRDNAQTEVVDHLETGFIVNSPQDFAAAIRLLEEQRSVRIQMGKNAREKALRLYDARVICRSLGGLIAEQLLKKNVSVPRLKELTETISPNLSEIEHYWQVERLERGAVNWSGTSPSRIKAPLRQLCWGIVDCVEFAARRLGALRDTAK